MDTIIPKKELPANIKKRKETCLRRQGMRRVIVTLKVDRENLSSDTEFIFKKMFWEAQLVWNYLIDFTVNRQKKISDWKPTNEIERYIPIKKLIYKKGKVVNCKKGEIVGYYIPYTLEYLHTGCRNKIPDQMKSNIRTLSSLKKGGKKIGALKYQKRCNQINFGSITSGYWKLIDDEHIKLGSVPTHLKVRGWKEQFSKYKNPEICDLKLIRKVNGYYINISLAVDWEERKCEEPVVGIDMGIKTSITTSDGDKYKILISETKKLKKLQQKLARQVKGSERYWITLRKIKKEYDYIVNKRNHEANILVFQLRKKYETIIMQDEMLTNWKASKSNSKGVQNSILGRVKAKVKDLEKRKEAVILPRNLPTTKKCFKCGTMVKLSLNDRIFSCPKCGYTEDRDIKASKAMIHGAIFLKMWSPPANYKLP